MGPITSSFGQREDPVLHNGEGEFHAGIDISGSGRDAHPRDRRRHRQVSRGSPTDRYSREIIIDHGHGLETCYAHMSGFTVMPGETVVRGQVIGYVGLTGRITGANLHYEEVRIHNAPVNPHKYSTVAGVGHVDVLRIVGRVERDAKGMIQSCGELLDLGGLTVISHATQNPHDLARSERKRSAAFASATDQARLREGAFGALHVFDVVGALHRRVVPNSVPVTLNPGYSRPRVGRLPESRGACC